MTQKFFYNKRIVNFRDQGTGKVIVLLHGYLESLKIWDEFSYDLKNKYRVVSIDLPGHGQSSLGEGPPSIEKMADVVNAVLEKLRIKKAVIVGHSMGGYVGLKVLKKYTHLVQGLCLFHSHAAADSPERKERRFKEIDLIREGKKDLIIKAAIPNAFARENLVRLHNEIGFAKEIAAEVTDRGMIAALESMANREDMTSALKFVTIPVMFVMGMKDENILPKMIEEQSNLPKNARVVKLEDSGHMGFIEDFSKSISGVSAFADACR